MGHSYQAVGWNRQKRIYDLVLLGGVVLYLALFIGLGAVLHPSATAETLIIRGLATAAFVLLHIILVIGPLARLNPRFLPLLYNRRHMGVTMFVLALGHGVFSIIQFHALGPLNPLVSVFVSEHGTGALATFPFQPFGLLALLILFLMAATSHDFWLTNLTAPVWKALHMLVYIAYGLIVLHVALGVLQAETSPLLAVLTGAGMATVLILHVVAGWRERPADALVTTAAANGFVDACGVDEIEENKARIVTIAGERVAVFKYSGKVSAVSNVCKHQNGPLGEGCIIDGYITCPWHGYQYHPDTGASPAPFTERIPTFNVRIREGRVLVAGTPNPPGTPVQPALVDPTPGTS
ncbi:MAG: Rieske 2Fe-2S domain-containing protein [Bacteroidota bacterium]